jgi:cell division protein ZapB
MEEHLSALEDRVRLAAELCQHLRIENNELRQQLAKLNNDNKRLSDKISGARERLEGLLVQIPE